MTNAAFDQEDDKGGSRINSIYNALFQAILAQELVPGTKLREETIGSMFQVSRTIVRAALNRLHTEALVEFRPNRGAFVASTTPEEARQVFEARNAIEREVFSKLAERITDRQIAALEKHLELEHRADGVHNHTEAILLSGNFHLLAAEMAGNQVLAGFLKTLISRTSLILVQHSTGQDTECSVDEHAQVLAALRKRDPEAASAAILDHMHHVFRRARIGQNPRVERDLTDILSTYL